MKKVIFGMIICIAISFFAQYSWSGGIRLQHTLVILDNSESLDDSDFEEVLVLGGWECNGTFYQDFEEGAGPVEQCLSACIHNNQPGPANPDNPNDITLNWGAVYDACCNQCSNGTMEMLKHPSIAD